MTAPKKGMITPQQERELLLEFAEDPIDEGLFDFFRGMWAFVTGRSGASNPMLEKYKQLEKELQDRSGRVPDSYVTDYRAQMENFKAEFERGQHTGETMVQLMIELSEITLQRWKSYLGESHILYREKGEKYVLTSRNEAYTTTYTSDPEAWLAMNATMYDFDRIMSRANQMGPEDRERYLELERERIQGGRGVYEGLLQEGLWSALKAVWDKHKIRKAQDEYQGILYYLSVHAPQPEYERIRRYLEGKEEELAKSLGAKEKDGKFVIGGSLFDDESEASKKVRKVREHVEWVLQYLEKEKKKYERSESLSDDQPPVLTEEQLHAAWVQDLYEGMWSDLVDTVKGAVGKVKGTVSRWLKSDDPKKKAKARRTKAQLLKLEQEYKEKIAGLEKKVRERAQQKKISLSTSREQHKGLIDRLHDWWQRRIIAFVSTVEDDWYGGESLLLPGDKRAAAMGALARQLRQYNSSAETPPANLNEYH